uniref:Chitin-binding type-2 domain-containing protein n=2 Tax=Octopus bimaculoides TaxID=37653 RepID=A0A0L8H3S3_OCTBM
MKFHVAVAVLLIAVSAVYCKNIMTLCKQVQTRIGANYVRSPKNCSEFYFCNPLYPQPLSCGKYTVFSQSQQVCVWKHSQYDDCNRHIYGGRFNDPLCKPYLSGCNRDPQDCHRFIPCYNGTSYPSMACQSGLFFNVQLQRCTGQSQANCRKLFF